MKKSAFIQRLDQAAIAEAIAAAELNTSGEIRVVLAHEPAEDAVQAAQATFTKLGMDKTRERNGVLIFVAPESQTFAVIGDVGVHTHCGQEFWNEMATAMSTAFAAGDFSLGLRQAIAKAGSLLKTHFPRQDDDQNELPDTVVEQ